MTPPVCTVTATAAPSRTSAAAADTLKLATSLSRTVTVALLGEPARYLAGLAGVSPHQHAVTVGRVLHNEVIDGPALAASTVLSPASERHRRRWRAAEDPGGRGHLHAHRQRPGQRGDHRLAVRMQREHRVVALSHGPVLGDRDLGRVPSRWQRW